MSKDDKKNDSENDDDASEYEEDYSGDSLLSFIEVQGDDKARKAPPQKRREKRRIKPASPDAKPPAGDLTVDDVLEGRPLELGPAPSTGKPPIPQPITPESSASETPPCETRPLELTPPAAETPPLKLTAEEQAEVDTAARAAMLQPAECAPEGGLKVDDEYLAKLDQQLKDELTRLRDKNQPGMIPGRFLEARKILTQEGTLECPQCKIKVTDTPGKIDYCPQCGLALDDYLHQFRREWESKYKHRTSYGVKEFGPQKPKPGETAWEKWKEEQGIDPEAEVLECPQCGTQVVDDPFVAHKCPKCHIPLDLHLQFPRPYIQERENKRKHRVGMDDDLEDKIKRYQQNDS